MDDKPPRIFTVNAGGCNGCDIEIAACVSPRYHCEQIGMLGQASPKHADILLITGTWTKRSHCAILDVYAQMPSPKAVVAIGSCPASGNVFAGSPTIDGPIDKFIPVDVWVSGCPPRPQLIIAGIAQAAQLLADGRTADQKRVGAPRPRAMIEIPPGDMPPRPPTFRGLIEQDVSLCTGCRACAYVCSPKAISFAEEYETGLTWNFFAGQCSFCGLCVQYCPTHAITNRGKLPPVTGDQSLLKVAHEIPYHPCVSCGKPIIPMPEEALKQVYGGAPTELQAAQRTMCQDCRRKAASRPLHNVFWKS